MILISFSHASDIPEDVSYTIISENIVPRHKRGLDVRINKKVSERVLEAIAFEIKESDSRKFKRTLIGFYLPEMELNKGCWATTHFDPELEVRIIGLSIEEEKKLTKTNTNSQATIVGSWLQEDEPFPGKLDITLIEETYYLEKTYRDGGKSKDALVEKRFKKGRKFVKEGSKKGSDYYLITKKGVFQLWSQDYDGSYVLVVEAKPIMRTRHSV